MRLAATIRRLISASVRYSRARTSALRLRRGGLGRSPTVPITVVGGTSVKCGFVMIFQAFPRAAVPNMVHLGTDVEDSPGASKKEAPRRRGREQHGEPSGRLSDWPRRGANVSWEAILARTAPTALAAPPQQPISRACRFVLMLSAPLRGAHLLVRAFRREQHTSIRELSRTFSESYRRPICPFCTVRVQAF